jgi:hypothetical protein
LAHLTEQYGLDVTVTPVLMPGPETVDAAAKQVMAEKAIDFMTRAPPTLDDHVSVIL